jgi:hypothetical protein
MGRMVPSFRIALEQEISTWRDFRNSLGLGSRKLLDAFFDEARNHCSTSSNSVRPVRFEAMLMGIVAAHERRLTQLASEMERLRLEANAQD